MTAARPTSSAVPARRALLSLETARLALQYARVHGIRALVVRSLEVISPKPPYDVWIGRYDRLRQRDIAAIRAHLAVLPAKPLISVVMPVYNTKPQYLRKAIESILAQFYPRWELCIADDASTDPEIKPILEEYGRADPRIKITYRARNGHIAAASNSALELATGEFVALMDHDDELPPHALYRVAVELDAHPDAEIIYSDEDKIDAEGRRHEPYFKTDWNPALLQSQNMINHLGVYRSALLRRIGGFREGFDGSQDYDLVLRATARTPAARIRHIPEILYHWRLLLKGDNFSMANAPAAQDAARRALVANLAETGVDAEVTSADELYWRVKRPLPQPAPKVSLIVPTRDRLELLRPCVDGLLERTAYPDLEVIVVDNDSRDPATLVYLEELEADPRVRVLRIGGAFNFSALNNRAVEVASGALVGLINNDVEVIEPDWLEEMVSQAAQPGVGAVGAKLYYSNGRIQHAGVALGIGGVAGHVHRNALPETAGYFGFLRAVRDVSCVTAACMLVWTEIFREVGGFDEVNLQVALNDVDLCLKIREAGYRLIWTPFAELYHRESASRGSDMAARHIARFRREVTYMKEHWGRQLQDDPFYNPNLSLGSETFGLAFPPRAEKPWRRYRKRLLAS